MTGSSTEVCLWKKKHPSRVPDVFSCCPEASVTFKNNMICGTAFRLLCGCRIGWEFYFEQKGCQGFSFWLIRLTNVQTAIAERRVCLSYSWWSDGKPACSHQSHSSGVTENMSQAQEFIIAHSLHLSQGMASFVDHTSKYTISIWDQNTRTEAPEKCDINISVQRLWHWILKNDTVINVITYKWHIFYIYPKQTFSFLNCYIYFEYVSWNLRFETTLRFVYSPFARAGSLQVLQLHPTVQRHAC